jgi:hypothetical protein
MPFIIGAICDGCGKDALSVVIESDISDNSKASHHTIGGEVVNYQYVMRRFKWKSSKDGVFCLNCQIKQKK